MSATFGVNNIMQVQMAMEESMFWERYMSRIALQMKRTAVSEESTQDTNGYQCLFEMSPS